MRCSQPAPGCAVRGRLASKVRPQNEAFGANHSDEPTASGLRPPPAAHPDRQALRVKPQSMPSPFWSRWLLMVTIGVMVFGLVPVLAPGLTRESFSWLVYADVARTAGFGSEAVEYIALVHAVLGAVMFGWGLALLLVVRGLFARGAREGWQIIAVSVAAWFIPDTAFSLWSGFWQNALLNLVFMLLFSAPLAATYRGFHEARA